MRFEQIYEEIDRLRRVNPNLVRMASGVTADWVAKAEARLGVRLPPSFVHYLLHFGGATINGETVNGLLGLDFEDACGPDVVYNTLLDRANAGLDTALIVLVDNDGDELFYLDTSRLDEERENPVVRVLSEAPEDRQPYATTFADFLLKRIQFFLRAADPRALQ